MRNRECRLCLDEARRCLRAGCLGRRTSRDLPTEEVSKRLNYILGKGPLKQESILVQHLARYGHIVIFDQPKVAQEHALRLHLGVEALVGFGYPVAPAGCEVGR